MEWALKGWRSRRLARDQAPMVRLVLGRGLRIVAIGTALGLVGAYAGARLIGRQLFGVAADLVNVCGGAARAGGRGDGGLLGAGTAGCMGGSGDRLVRRVAARP